MEIGLSLVCQMMKFGILTFLWRFKMKQMMNSTRGPSTHTGPGGNWPSTTGNPSGGGRGNAK